MKTRLKLMTGKSIILQMSQQTSKTYHGAQFVPLNYSMHAKMVPAYRILGAIDHKDMDVFSP